MSELTLFIEEMLAKYGDAAEVIPARECVNLQDVPQPLVEFYSHYDSCCFPFGRIDPPDVSSRHSVVAEPFRSEGCFCFGSDEYAFSFWLCAINGPDEDGCVFTSWDHDLDDGIEYAFCDLVGLLRYAEKEYLETSGE